MGAGMLVWARAREKESVPISKDTAGFVFHRPEFKSSLGLAGCVTLGKALGLWMGSFLVSSRAQRGN